MKNALLFFLCFQVSVLAQNAIETFTKDMQKYDGFLPFYWDNKQGKVYLEINQFDTELLYYPTLAQGVGSNDIGLDRGRLGQEHVVQFQRSGNKILMIEPNYSYRAISNDEREKRAVAESFAQSVHAGFVIEKEADKKVLVDFTPFLMQDAIGAVQDIARTKQGTFRFDASKSAMYLPRTKNFPQNTEFEVTITLVGENAGRYLREVVPTPSNITMRQHHSFVALPEVGFQKRTFDPRIGYGGIEYFDYATPISEPIMKRYISRHRLQKKDPAALVSEAIKPIVYYMDSGAPEPIRSALMEGAAWWNQAFEAAGYKDAFQVKILPDDADPMDIRYNLIQWVHRSTRGWSYGSSIIDPRTGEILKGKVTLGSLRVRQDFLIAEGLIGQYDDDSSAVKAMMAMSLDRLRQLAAHEIGHTLGLPHNYIASSQGRVSVMDYPHPLVDIQQGNRLDLSNAYAKGIGEYDKFSIIWGYQDFPKGTDEKTELEKIVQRAIGRGFVFLTDQDARPEGSAHPETHLWDNGNSAVSELKRVMEVRRIALQNFSEKKIRVGYPLSSLEEVFVPMYMFHRYQVESAVKSIAGIRYNFALRGDGQKPVQIVGAKEQRQAFDAVMTTLQANFLAVPKTVLDLIPPRAFRYDANPREIFKRNTGLTFDPLAPAQAAAGMSLRLLLNPERCARLVSQKVMGTDLPTLAEVLDKMSISLWKNTKIYTQNSHEAQISRLVAMFYLEQLMKLANNKDAAMEVRANAFGAIDNLRIWLKENPQLDGAGFARFSLLKIRQFEENPETAIEANVLIPPDGQPIESGYDWLDLDCEKH